MERREKEAKVLVVGNVRNFFEWKKNKGPGNSVQHRQLAYQISLLRRPTRSLLARTSGSSLQSGGTWYPNRGNPELRSCCLKVDCTLLLWKNHPTVSGILQKAKLTVYFRVRDFACCG